VVQKHTIITTPYRKNNKLMKKILLPIFWLIVISGVVGTGVIFAVRHHDNTVRAQTEPNDYQVKVCTGANFSGTCKVYGVGEQRNFGSATQDAYGNIVPAIFNDAIRSIHVGGKVTVTLCQDANFETVCRTYSPGKVIQDATDYNINWTGNPTEYLNTRDCGGVLIASSMSVMKASTGLDVNKYNTNCVPDDNQIAIYDHDNFAGVCRILNVNYYPHYARWGQNTCHLFIPYPYCLYDNIAYGQTLMANDTISSVKIGKNVNVTFYEDEKYNGESLQFNGSRLIASLHDDFDGDGVIDYWGDRISSIKVSASASVAPAVVDINARRSNIGAYSDGPVDILSGDSVGLKWETSNCTAGSISITGVGPVDATGTTARTPSGTTTYTISCSNSAGEVAQDSVTINSNLRADIKSFTANPSSLYINNTSILSWSANNVRTNNACTVNQGVGTFNSNITQQGVTRSTAQDVTFTITCYGAFDPANNNDTAQIVVRWGDAITGGVECGYEVADQVNNEQSVYSSADYNKNQICNLKATVESNDKPAGNYTQSILWRPYTGDEADMDTVNGAGELMPIGTNNSIINEEIDSVSGTSTFEQTIQNLIPDLTNEEVTQGIMTLYRDRTRFQPKYSYSGTSYNLRTELTNADGSKTYAIDRIALQSNPIISIFGDIFAQNCTGDCRKLSLGQVGTSLDTDTTINTQYYNYQNYQIQHDSVLYWGSTSERNETLAEIMNAVLLRAENLNNGILNGGSVNFGNDNASTAGVTVSDRVWKYTGGQTIGRNSDVYYQGPRATIVVENGNLTIGNDFIKQSGAGPVGIIVKDGNVTIADTVARLDVMLFVPNGTVTINSRSSDMVFSGLIVANKITLGKLDGGNWPVTINYDPDIANDPPPGFRDIVRAINPGDSSDEASYPFEPAAP